MGLAPEHAGPHGKSATTSQPKRIVSDYRDLEPAATTAGIPYLAFRKVSEPAVFTFVREHKPDLLWVIGISQLVPDQLIELAPAGGIGFHPTKLPRGRGRAPVAWTILIDEQPAVSLFFLTDEADAGDILAQRNVELRPDDYAVDLIQRTNFVLHDVITDLAPHLISGHLPRKPQDHALATFHGKRTPKDGIILWNRPVALIHRLIRATSHPYPGAYTFHGQDKMIIWRADVSTAPPPSDGWHPGRIHTGEKKESICVECADGMLEITDYDYDGSAQPKPGDRLG